MRGVIQRKIQAMKNKTPITPALLSAVYEQPWSIEAGALRAIQSIIERPQSFELGDLFQSRSPMSIDENGIATISVTGILGDHAPIAGLLGDTDYSTVSAELAEAEANALGVLLCVDSPGGQSCGNLEAASVVSNLSIPSVAMCEGMACSAGYAYASATDKVFSTPSALVGSIGVVIPRLDVSEALISQGLKPDNIVSDELKGAGMSGAALTPEQRESMQEIVNDLANAFKEHVTDRRAVDASSMRGQAFVGPRAMEHNLVDAIGSTKDAYIDLIEMIG